MIAGLEFLKSWRFWLMLMGSTLAITLGSAGAYIASVLYLPLRSGEPDPLYPMLVPFMVFCLLTVLFWLYYRRREQGQNYPEEHNIRLFLGLALATSIVVIMERVAVNWLIVKPLMSHTSNGGVYSAFPFIFALFLGQSIAKAEWAAMTGAGVERKRSVIPDSP